MEKEENFIIMGAIIGILLLIVIILGVFLKPEKAVVTDRDTVTDTKVVEEQEDTSKYEEIKVKKNYESITSDFTLSYPLDTDDSIKSLFYQTDYYNYYVVGYSHLNVKVNYNGTLYPLEDAINNEIVTIYDLMQKSDLIKEERRYEFTFGEKITKSYKMSDNYLNYKDGRELSIVKDDIEDKSLYQILSDITIDEFKTILEVGILDGNFKGYIVNNSNMYELEDTRIYICNNNDIYVGDGNLEYPCK